MKPSIHCAETRSISVCDVARGWLLVALIGVVCGLIGYKMGASQARSDYAAMAREQVSLVVDALDGVSGRLMNMIEQEKPASQHQLKLAKTELEKTKERLKEAVK